MYLLEFKLVRQIGGGGESIQMSFEMHLCCHGYVKKTAKVVPAVQCVFAQLFFYRVPLFRLKNNWFDFRVSSPVMLNTLVCETELWRSRHSAKQCKGHFSGPVCSHICKRNICDLFTPANYHLQSLNQKKKLLEELRGDGNIAVGLLNQAAFLQQHINKPLNWRLRFLFIFYSAGCISSSIMGKNAKRTVRSLWLSGLYFFLS